MSYQSFGVSRRLVSYSNHSPKKTFNRATELGAWERQTDRLQHCLMAIQVGDIFSTTGAAIMT